MKKTKIQKTQSKILIILLGILIASIISFSTVLLSSQVQAQEQWVCCVVDGKCNDYMLRSECIEQGGRAFSKACSEVPECMVGACIPKITKLSIGEVLISDCQYGKHRAECEAQGGAFSAGMPELCQKGCCQIPNTVIGRVCANLPLFVCKETARRDGGNYTFKEGTSSDECYDICGREKLGCCVLGDGECKYHTRGECVGTFYEGLYCYQVGSPQCIVEQNAYEACCSPLTVRGGEIKRAICSFDSAGNQEETLRECSYPESKCEICNSETCKDVNKTTVYFGDPYCKDRSCYLEEAEGSQEVKEEKITKKAVTFETKKAPTKLLHGQSVCYNFFSGQGGLDLNDKSTGLQNQILRCFEGELEIQQLGVDRETLCVQINPVSVKTFENNHEKCRECANKGGFWNMIKDSFLAVQEAPVVLRITPDNCTEEACEALGKIRIDGITKQMCWYNYDSDWPNHGEGIGSCDPIYPPGTTTMCKECGGGGDWLYNVCDKAECLSLGNCQTAELGWKTSVMHRLSRFIPAFLAWRVAITPTIDCVGEALIRCPLKDPVCIAGAWAWCLTDRTKYVNPICWAASATKNLWSNEAARRITAATGVIASLGVPMPTWLRATIGVPSIVAALKGETNKTKEGGK